MADQSVEEQNVDNDVVESGKGNGIVDTVKDDGGQEVADNQLKNEGEGKSPGTDWKAEARKWGLVSGRRWIVYRMCWVRFRWLRLLGLYRVKRTRYDRRWLRVLRRGWLLAGISVRRSGLRGSMRVIMPSWVVCGIPGR